MSTPTITITGLRARGHHGVFEHERRDGQDFSADVRIELAPQIGRPDAVSATLHYGEVAEAVVQRLAGSPVDLLETLVEEILDAIVGLPGAGAARYLEVTVHKPQAPITVPFDDVTVTASRVQRGTTHPVVIALGANLADPRKTLVAALGQLNTVSGITVTGISPLVETDPVGKTDQPVFLNAVVLADSELSPPELMTTLHRLEASHGRSRDERWGPRTLDLDLVQYGDPRTGDQVVTAQGAPKLPHPRAGGRAFVLQPWSQLDPEARLDKDGPTVTELAERAPDAAGVRPGPPWPALLLRRGA